MDIIDKVRLMAEMDHDHCTLNHGPGISNEQIPAADYLVMSMGYRETADTEIAVRELIIPVCFDCAKALTGEEWTLLFCFECTENRWVCRRFAKNNYRHHILWLRGCPDCSNKFGGLYFNDASSYEGIAYLAASEFRIAV